MLSQLGSQLESELAALGKDISSTATFAPTGEGNGLQYLEVIYQRRSENSEQQYLATLYGREFLQGDYDGNGIVNAADLVMIAQYWQQTVTYRDISETGYNFPFANEPAGIADGNFDGLVNVSDITTIAQHWNEQLNGYRIFMDTEYLSNLLLPDGTYPGSELTITRGAEYQVELGTLLGLDFRKGFTFFGPIETGAGRDYSQFFYTAEFYADIPATLKVAPVNLSATPQQGAYTSVSTQVDDMPELVYELQLQSQTVPTTLTVDFSACRDEIPDSGQISMRLLDADGVQVGAEQAYLQQEKHLSLEIYDLETHSLELSFTDVYGNEASKVVEITPQADIVTNDPGWTLAHTGLIVPEPATGKVVDAALELIDGQPAIACIIDQGKGPGHVSYLRSLDASGSSWPAPITAFDLEDFDPLGKIDWRHLQLWDSAGHPLIAMLGGESPEFLIDGRVWFYSGSDAVGSTFIAGAQFEDVYSSRISQPGGRMLLLTEASQSANVFVHTEQSIGGQDFSSRSLQGPTSTGFGHPLPLAALSSGNFYYRLENGGNMAFHPVLDADAAEVIAPEIVPGSMQRSIGNALQLGDTLYFLEDRRSQGGSSLHDYEFVFQQASLNGEQWTVDASARRFEMLNRFNPRYPHVRRHEYEATVSAIDLGSPMLVYCGRKVDLMYVRADQTAPDGIAGPQRIMVDDLGEGFSPLDAVSLESGMAILAVDNLSLELVLIRRN
ncbi:MAG: dockerin type I repeat-containing protein [bacterium]